MSLDEINVEIDQYFKTVEDYKKDGYEMMIDLTAVDWYRKKEPRFEIIVNLLSVSKNSRLIINAVSYTHLTLPTILLV